MSIAARPLWQQVTALVSLSTGGAITGFSFVPGAVADLTSPTSMPIRLMALEKAAQPTASSDAMLRSAIVNVANYYLRMAAAKTPAAMEQIIWQQDSLDGLDHGPSCAAFASLTLELGAQMVGQQSWVTGGTSYPWPLHKWADVRVDPNPSSLGITSILQDAQANDRWHPLGDGYQPMPGDWVLFDGHVEVVTSYSGGTLHTIGGDSGPNLSVNAHDYPGPFAAQGVVGFVDNGGLAAGAGQPPSSPAQPAAAPQGPGEAVSARADSGKADIPGVPAAGASQAAPAGRQAGTSQPASPANPDGAGVQGPPAQPARPRAHRRAQRQTQRQTQRPGHVAGDAGTDAGVPGTSPLWSATTPTNHGPGAAAIPGLPSPPHGRRARSAGSGSAPHRRRHQPTALRQSPSTSGQPAASGQPSAYPSPEATSSQQEFINEIAPGAIAAQHKYGVPAAVTIAQAIEESGWGQSGLATRDHNLFGIKGTGPAGYDMLPTQEFEHGQMVNSTGIFRVYYNYAQSIDDHGRLLATSGYYRQAMANRLDPNKFAAALTGIYATDPQYGAKLINIMQRYNLYRYDAAQPAGSTSQAPTGGTSIPGVQPGSAPAPPVSPARPSPPSRPAHHVRPVRPAHHVRPGRTAQPAGSVPGPQVSPPGSTPEPSGPAPTPAPSWPTPAPQPSATPRPAPSPNMTPGPRTSPSPPRRTKKPLQVQLVSDIHLPRQASQQSRAGASRAARPQGSHYHHHLPLPVRNAFLAAARGPIMHAKPLYRDVASHHGLRWELLAACDWMQCEARPRYSPVHGEKLGAVNPDGTIYHTKSEALAQCAEDLIDLANAVYQIDVTAEAFLSVRELANVFAAFRWGALLKLHRTSAMEFPYSVAGLTEQHLCMRWPKIDEPNAPDKPGARFHRPFGAVPAVLGLNYPAIA